MISKIKRFQGLGRLIPGLLISIVVVMMMKMNAWVPLERAVNNQLIVWRGAQDWDSRIVMVSVDDKTLEAFGQFPISRDYYTQLLWLLTKEDASVVAFNILLPDSVTEGQTPAESSAINASLAAAMDSQGRVVLGQAWNERKEAIRPMPLLAETAIAVGHLQFQAERDGMTREVAITWEKLPNLGVAAIQAYGLQEELIRIPTELRKLRINWPNSANELTTVGLSDVLSGHYIPGFFKDKIVIVSYGATIGQVQIKNPFDSQIPVPSGFVHAAVIDTLLKQNWLRPVPENAVIFVLLVSGTLFSGLIYHREVILKLIIGGTLLVGWLTAAMAALYLGYLLPVVPPLATLVLVGVAVTMLKQIQANALLQVRSAFLNTMSHEIRTPLNAIVNLSEMLQETELNDRQQEFAETLNNSSQTLLALINDVLDFSKIESGRLMIEQYPVRISDTVERSLEMLAPRAAEKGLELVYSITPATPAVIMSDPVRLQQILLNLLSNAVKFTETGEISVQVQATTISKNKALFSLQRLNPGRWRKHRVWPSKNRLSRARLAPSEQQTTSQFQSIPAPKTSLYEIRFAVHDTGIGIPSEQLSQLFRPFSQISAATTRKYGGTGLGLSISKRLSERMGGDLWVRSYLGEGSAFYFTVQAHLAEMRSPLPTYLSSLSGTRLLLVDRNITRSNHLTWELQPLGISLAQATSLSEARSFMQNDPTFDGIVLDEAIASSFEECTAAINTLRKIARNKHLPVILLRTLQAISAQANPKSNLSDTTIIWKPAKQAALYQALRAIHPVTLAPPSPIASPTTSPTASMPPAEEALPTLISQTKTETHRACLEILIAEDNRINQKVALRLLELLGYRADVVNSGVEVLQALKRRQYDVILMDMRMPELDGIEATRQIRQLPQHRGTWIIAMTANAMERDRQRCFAAGMDDYLSKPVNRKALDQALLRCPIRKAG